MTPDAFGTAALRAAVLGAWRASPARLREDANLEEDHARGYYRDRVLVELAQNAADAATRAGVPGRLLLRLARTDDGTVLVAANTGDQLDAAGVAALASMRASAKRDARPGVVGRFGVGFAAVRAVSDEVVVLSGAGGVRFSLQDTRATLAEVAAAVPALADEVRRRDGSLPALRLPFATDGSPPLGYGTAVVLRLRDEVAADEVRALLGAVGDPLLLALPGLVEVLVEDETSDTPSRRIADVERRWLLARSSGLLPAEVLADRPVEERDSRAWSVTWAVPREGATFPAVVHAPTPTDEPCGAPALLVGTFPLDPTRRHIAPGALTDAVLEHAADVYADLAAAVAAAGGDPLRLVPTGLASGVLDGALLPRLVARLAVTPLLAPAAPLGDERVAPSAAVAVEGAAGQDRAALAALGRRVTGLVALAPGRETQARLVGVDLRPLADLVEDLPATDDDGWRELYDALDALAADPQAREALGSLPVPLADGRVVRGARGVLLVAPDLTAALGHDACAELSAWGLRIVDPRGAHPLLERLGAATPDAVGLLREPAVRRAVLDQSGHDDLDDDRTTATVLALVQRALGGSAEDPDRPLPSEQPDALPDDVRAWLGLLALPAADGTDAPADGLVLPGSVAADLLDERVLGTVAVAAVERWGAAVLVAAGVRRDLVVVRVPDVVADALGPDEDALAAQSLDGWEDYLDEVARVLGPGAYVGEVTAVADLDAVHPDAWRAVLERVAAVPALRRALVERPRADGRTVESYTAWWLRERTDLGLGGPFLVAEVPDDGHSGADDDEADDERADDESREPHGGVRAAPAWDVSPGAVARPLVERAPDLVAGLDAEVQRALGGVAGLEELEPPAWTRLLDAWGPIGSAVPPALAATVWHVAAPDEPPERVAAVVAPGRVAVVRADDAAVAPSPMWWQRTDVAALVAVLPQDAARVARALALPSVAELTPGVVDRDGARAADVPPVVRWVLPHAPATWLEHDDLRVDHVPVEWWVEGEGPDAQVHAVHLAGLAAGLAQAAGAWGLRHAVEAVLADPDRAAEIALDAAVTGRQPSPAEG